MPTVGHAPPRAKPGGSSGRHGSRTFFRALRKGCSRMEKNDARSKHIILLTDGQSEGGDYDGLLKRMEAAHITLSGVAVGADADQQLLQYLQPLILPRCSLVVHQDP